MDFFYFVTNSKKAARRGLGGGGGGGRASEKSIGTKKCCGSEIELSAGIKFDSVTPILKTAQGGSHGSSKRLEVLAFT